MSELDALDNALVALGALEALGSSDAIDGLDILDTLTLDTFFVSVTGSANATSGGRVQDETFVSELYQYSLPVPGSIPATHGLVAGVVTFSDGVAAVVVGSLLAADIFQFVKKIS